MIASRARKIPHEIEALRETSCVTRRSLDLSISPTTVAAFQKNGVLLEIEEQPRYEPAARRIHIDGEGGK
jgi:hypothetical protein